MKRVFVLIIMILGLFGSSAQAEEILFRSIPWGSNMPDVLNAMPPYSNECDFDWETRIDAWNSFNASYGKSNNGGIPSIYYYGDLSVAGYKVNSVTFQFLYSVDDEGKVQRSKNDMMLKGAMYRLEVADIDFASSDLMAKLTELYGNGTKGTNEVNNPIVTWYGDNNTGVCLEYSTDFIVIWYGNTDESIITSLDAALAREEQEKAVGNKDGL